MCEVGSCGDYEAQQSEFLAIKCEELQKELDEYKGKRDEVDKKLEARSGGTELQAASERTSERA